MYLLTMVNMRLLLVLLGVVALAVLAGCSSPTPTPVPTPTAIPDSSITALEAGAFIRAVLVREPGCGQVDLRNTDLRAEWEPDTRSWLVRVTAPGGLEGAYRLFEERGFTVDVEVPLISGVC